MQVLETPLFPICFHSMGARLEYPPCEFDERLMKYERLLVISEEAYTTYISGSLCYEDDPLTNL